MVTLDGSDQPVAARYQIDGATINTFQNDSVSIYHLVAFVRNFPKNFSSVILARHYVVLHISH